MSEYEYMDFPIAESPESLPDELLYASFFPESSSLSPSQVPPSTRSNSYPSYEKMTAVKPQETHTILRIETGEDEFIRKHIHRLNEVEKHPVRAYFNGEPPNFVCKLNGCRQPWIRDRSQFKGHLLEHGVCFNKPWGCSCGSQFSRQVEAARHLEDLKACPKCGNSGRKLKGFGGLLICHRCQKKEKIHSKNA
ncbi:hypothetical protein Clacol_008771 [Clathrus columnatus]|uniref:C2H2-type domain-containing protein n=1 Tax=Clathrus columnatus TaxID=1419009 RepID=A0AAV5AIM6_9AGAM|nr:hypothetical protein Clacol_008771 [Clathrus columnatus]